ncbi:hypothetical protein LXL04_036442 [Taraxacum kok-saghyz]
MKRNVKATSIALGDATGSDKCEVVARAQNTKAKVQAATCVLDCDGFINLEEFAGFCKENTGDQDGEMNELYAAFELYDLNKNRLISSTELHQILTRLGERCTVEDCVKMIKSVDSDVDFEEFKKMMSRS